MAGKNALLETLQITDGEFERLFKPIELVTHKVIHEKNKTIRYVYFVTEGVISMVNEPNNGEIVEIATVGKDGFAGVPVLLGAKTMPSRALVQIAGGAFRITVKNFLTLVDQDRDFHALLMRYTMALINQIAQSTSCNRLHEVQERCARWLLQSHDRVSGDSFELTQDFLAQMLGCHRPTVSIAAGMLQNAGYIEYSRGKITILDRKGLESASCNCYRVVKNEYEKLLRPE